ncbi:MAG: hypothetical protein ABIA78_01225 [archaeon]
MKEVGKSYNSFKMWGSWVGLVIGLGILIQGIGMRGNGIELSDLLLGFLIYIVLGFLIGWAIHSLIRKYKN